MNWDQWRENFPVTQTCAFFDHAAVAPIPSTAARAMAEYADDVSRQGVLSFRKWMNRSNEVRGYAGRLLNADPLDVAFIPSTTMGITLVAEGFPWQPGDSVVTCAEEYPANQYPWMNLADRGVTLRRVPSRENRIPSDDLIAACDSSTKLMTVSAVEFASGFRHDLMRLGEWCRARGIFFFVDAIQQLGAIPLDVAKLPIDALAADGHKWMLGPEGLGIFWLRREWLDRLRPIGVGSASMSFYDYSRIEMRLKPHAGRYEGGTKNFCGIAGFGESLKLLLSAGLDRVRDRVKDLTDRLAEGAKRAGVAVFSSREGEEWSGIVSLAVPEPVKAMRRCREAGIIVNVRGDRLRVSPHAYNTPEEVDRLIDVLANR